MATQNLQLNLPAYNSSNWNQALNSNWAIVDAAAGSTTAIPVTAVDYYLRDTDLQANRIQVVGNQGASNISVVFPNGICGKWIVTNNAFTSGGKLFVRTNNYTLNPIEIPLNASLLIFSEGNNLGTIGLSENILGNYLKVSGGTMTGDLTMNRSIKFAPYPDLPASSRIVDTAQSVGFYNSTASARAIMDEASGRWTASGGVGIGANGAVAQALAAYCPSAVYNVPGEDRIKGVSIEDVLVKLIEEIVSLKDQLASKTL